MFLKVLCASFLLMSCMKSADQSKTEQSKEDAGCVLPNGKYPVQSAELDNDTGVYALFVLNAPACVKMPVAVEGLQLMRLEEGSKEKAVLQYEGQGREVLSMAQDFPIKLVQVAPDGQGVMQSQSSSWTPFLSGMAGAAIAGMAANALFNRPRHYVPPPMNSGNRNLAGFGGVGDTKAAAVNNYQDKFKSKPRLARKLGSSSKPSALKRQQQRKLLRNKKVASPLKKRRSFPLRRKRR